MREDASRFSLLYHGGGFIGAFNRFILPACASLIVLLHFSFSSDHVQLGEGPFHLERDDFERKVWGCVNFFLSYLLLLSSPLHVLIASLFTPAFTRRTRRTFSTPSCSWTSTHPDGSVRLWLVSNVVDVQYCYLLFVPCRILCEEPCVKLKVSTRMKILDYFIFCTLLQCVGVYNECED